MSAAPKKILSPYYLCYFTGSSPNKTMAMSFLPQVMRGVAIELNIVMNLRATDFENFQVPAVLTISKGKFLTSVCNQNLACTNV